jgi:hypothetical protein
MTNVLFKVKGRDELRNIFVEAGVTGNNILTNACLAVAQSYADNNNGLKEEDYPKAYKELCRFFTEDKKIVSATGGFKNWRQSAYRSAAAAIAFVADPDGMRKDVLRTKDGKGPADIGLKLVRKQAGTDKRASNAAKAKAKGATSKGSKAKQEAPKGALVIKARRFGDAMLDVIHVGGEINGIRADKAAAVDVAQMIDLLNRAGNTIGKLAKEFDALREHGGERYVIETGSVTDKYADLI